MVDKLVKPPEVTRAEYRDARDTLFKLIERRKNKNNGKY